MAKVKFVFTSIISFVLILSLITTVFASTQVVSSDNSSTPHSNEYGQMLELNDLTENELKELCDRVNGIEGLSPNDSFCLSTANAIISYYHSKYSKQRIYMPDYLLSAYNSISEKQNNILFAHNTRSTQYVISNSGKFRVYYNTANTYHSIIQLAQFTGNLFDTLYYKYCTVYDFPAPIPDTNDGYYNIYIIPENILGASGLTCHPVAGHPEQTVISISQEQLIYCYEYATIDSSVEGVAAHELMHAILSASGIISSDSLQAASIHEAMGRAVGIETNSSYANRTNVCSDIRSFINQISFSLGSIDSSTFINGSAIFYLSIFEDYQGWEVLATMANDYDSDYSIFSNINTTLIYSFNDSIGNRYEKFLIYACAPDYYFSTSPANNAHSILTSPNSWGTPIPISQVNVTTSNYTINSTQLRSVPSLGCNILKISSTTSTAKRVTVTVNYSLPINSNADPFGACVIKNSTTGRCTASTGLVYNNELYTTFTMSISGNDTAYIVIANGGVYDNTEDIEYLTYTYSVSISDY